jgi:hypothetical protein
MSRNINLQHDIGAPVSADEGDAPYGREMFPATPTHTAAYIHDMARELHLMARRAELTFLAYLLEIAAQEAKCRKHEADCSGGG